MRWIRDGGDFGRPVSLERENLIAADHADAYWGVAYAPYLGYSLMPWFEALDQPGATQM